jgi:AraC-like DNA-binding protein
MSVRFSTVTVDRRSQLSYWHEVVCATFVRLGLEPLRPRAVGFRAEVTAQTLGSLQVATVISDPHAVYRSAAMIRGSPDDDMMVNLAIRGRAVVAQDGREAVLRPGDFTVHDSARACRIACPEPFRLLVVKIPRDVFGSRCPLPAGATAVTVPGDRGVGALFSALLRSLPANIGGLPPEAAGQVGDSVLELLATATSDLAGRARPGLPQQAQLLRARRYITDHLGDPELAPPMVAEALGVSVRYLYLLFEAENCSPFRWIIKRRLELAADLLADARQDGRSITDIAFGVGFKDTSHFSRAFRDQHGASPREYRERRIGRGPA